MKIVRTFAILAAAALAWACSPPKDASPSGGDAGVVRFATDWRAQAEQGGFYQALATGEYEKRGQAWAPTASSP
jgi:NitT/TauT family transport system substrate-binding protein